MKTGHCFPPQAIDVWAILLMFGLFCLCLGYSVDVWAVLLMSGVLCWCLGYCVDVWSILLMFGLFRWCLGYFVDVWAISLMFGLFCWCLGYSIDVWAIDAWAILLMFGLEYWRVCTCARRVCALCPALGPIIHKQRVEKTAGSFKFPVSALPESWERQRERVTVFTSILR